MGNIQDTINAFQLTIGNSDINLWWLIFNMILCTACSKVLRYTFIQRAGIASGRMQIANVLPLLAITTLLVITIVKSSLALSLGLVGALSIVRFRAPIKDPQELVYLFISIALGLGFGAGQILPTLVVFAGIIGVIFAWSSRPNPIGHGTSNFVAFWDQDSYSYGALTEFLTEYADGVILRRISHESEGCSASYELDFVEVEQFNLCLREFNQRFPLARYNYFSADNL